MRLILTDTINDRRIRNYYYYDTFGETIISHEDIHNRFRFNGEQYDPVTSQYYLRARYYNPVIGRFTQEDTYYGDGLNLYEYCKNNPILYRDPSGHYICPAQLTLFHYTNKKGMDGIIESMQLNPSLKANNPKDARYGNGQYLSDIKPYAQTPENLAKIFINVPNKYKYTHYIEIDVTGLDVILGRDGVFVIPNDVPLDLTNRIVSTGTVGNK